MNAATVRRTLAATAVVALLAPLAAAARERPIFELTDPRGDDHGAGNLVYPDNDDYRDGDLDLLSLSARAGDGGTWFTATFGHAIRQPERRPIDQIGTQLDSIAKLGFYTFNLDIYIDTDRKPGSGAYRTLPGRRVEIAPDSAWERAIILTPRPYYARNELERSVARALKQEMKRQGSRYSEADAHAMIVAIPDDLARHVFFPTDVRVRGAQVEFFVPAGFLGGTASADWGYTVLVSAADLEQDLDLSGRLGLTDRQEERLLILPVTPGRPRENVGGGREDDPLQPPILDLIVPPGASQADVLQDYSVPAGRLVQLHAVVPSKVNGATEKGAAEKGDAAPPEHR